ncbi:MAG: hypothetical protein HYX78_06195 [Armatimonadetes bacterium]|nr:hypothetical protein [Armatimonadota bacterium]
MDGSNDQPGSPAYVQVIIPPSVTVADPMQVNDYVTAVGISGKGRLTGGGDVRAVTVRQANDLKKLVVGAPNESFEDDFENGRKAEWLDLWEPTYVQNGKLVASCAPGTNNRTVVNGWNVADVSVGVDAQTSSVFGIFLRYVDGGNLVLAAYSPAAGGYIFFHEAAGGSWSGWIGPVSTPSLGLDVRMTASVVGPLATIYITHGIRQYSTSCTLVSRLGPGMFGLFHNQALPVVSGYPYPDTGRWLRGGSFGEGVPRNNGTDHECCR